jgi:hypothetical protein
MERLEFDDRDWESWYAQSGPNSGPMRTAYNSDPGYEFSGYQPGTRPGPWPQARQDYQYYARQDYQDYADEPAGASRPAPARPGNGSGPMAGWIGPQARGRPQPPPAPPGGRGTGYRAGGNDPGYGRDPYGTDPYGGDPYGGGSYRTGPYSNDPYNSGGRADSGRSEIMVADAPSPRRQQVARSPREESVTAAARVLAAADQRAAAITQQASYQAAMITQQVAYEAAETRDAAGREADHIVQRAAAQASAVREAAQLEAAEMRQAVVLMQTELSDLATRIANTFPNPVLPRTPPTELPAASPTAPPTAPPAAQPWPPAPAPEKPATRHAAPPPATRPGTRPTGKPGARPTGKPGARSAAKPASGQGRQDAAIRVAVIATSAVFLVAVVAGVAEIKLHGLSFFVFRSVGSGETGPGGLQEDQGPGQPDAPKPTPSHSTVRPILRPSITVHTG